MYNQEIFFLAHGPYTAPNVTVRIMDIYKFMNSKVPACMAPRCMCCTLPALSTCQDTPVKSRARRRLWI